MSIPLFDIQNTSCTDCELYANCKSVCNMCVDDVQENSLMIVGDYPAPSDDAKSTVMKSTKEANLHLVLKDIIHADYKKIYFTYALKCRPEAGYRPNHAQLAACGPYLLEELKRIKPKAVLLLGNTAAEAFGYQGGLNQLKSKVHDLTYKDDSNKTQRIKVIITYSPTFLDHNPKELVNFATSVDRAYTIATGVGNRATRIVKVETLQQVKQLVEYVKQTGDCVFDFETNAQPTHSPLFKATLLSISFQHGSSWTIPLEHKDSPFTREQVMKILAYISKYIFENPDIDKINHNIKFDMHVAAAYGFNKFRGRLSDTMLMHYHINEIPKHGLKFVVPTFFPYLAGWEDSIKGNTWENVPLDDLCNYAGIDTDGTFRIATILETILMQDERVYRAYRNMTMVVIRPLFEAEEEGMPIDRELLIKHIEIAEKYRLEIENKMRSYPQVKTFEKYLTEQRKLRKIEELELKKKEISDKYEQRKLLDIDKLKKQIIDLKAENTKNLSIKEQNKITSKIIGIEDKIKAKIAAHSKNVLAYDEKIRAIKTGEISVYKPINFASPKVQLGPLLYTKHGFNFPKFYDRKKREETMATGEEPLKMIKDDTGFIKDIQVYRAISINLNTFLKGILDAIDPKDRLHTRYNQHVAATGRLSSAEPNLQNISTHVKVDHDYVKEVVHMVKKSFTVPKGYALVSGDFSQLELRLMAEYAEEPTMIEAYHNNMDLHVITAANIMGVTVEKFKEFAAEVFDKWRQRAKAANFGLIYGQEVAGFLDYAFLKYGVKFTFEEAAHIREAFFILYPNIPVYHDTTIAKARKFGYTRTLFGTKRHYLNINDSDDYIRGMDERAAINHPIQGTGGQLTQFAIGLLHYRLLKEVKFVNTVHDSIMFLTPIHLVPYTVKIMKHTCENLPIEKFFKRRLKHVQLKMDIQVSTTNWKELGKYDEAKWLEDHALIFSLYENKGLKLL